MKVAALFVEVGGPYWLMGNRIDFWDINRDARLYRGPWPVIAHPPCERWGRYWSGGPSVRERKTLGDDSGCFESALSSVRRWGGVLEHPEGSHAWRRFDLPIPHQSVGWVQRDRFEWSCCVAQGNYGHEARKLTWLFAKSIHKPIELDWSICSGKPRLDEGFHSTEERRIARSQGIKPSKRLNRLGRVLTPRPFAEILVEIATHSRSLVIPSQ